MVKKTIEEIEKECHKIIDETKRYQSEAFKFFYQIYEAKEKLRSSGAKHLKYHNTLDRLAKTLTSGLDKKNKDLKDSYIEKLNILIDLKKDMLNTKNQVLINLMDPLVSNIKELRKQIKLITEGENESDKDKR